MDKEEGIVCAYCGIVVLDKDSWPHVDGDANKGIRKIDYFCSEEHKFAFHILNISILNKKNIVMLYMIF